MLRAAVVIKTALFLLLIGWAVTSASASPSNSCSVVGAVPFKAYFLPGEYRCLKSRAAAKALGMTELDPPNATPYKGRRSSCKFVGIRKSEVFFAGSLTRCFGSKKQAAQNHYRHGLQVTQTIPTPTPIPGSTPQPTPGPGETPAATPTAVTTPPAPGDPIAYHFPLGPVQPGYSGVCDALLSGDRTTIHVACTHNVTNASEAHLHFVPDNLKYCPLASPPLNFAIDCPLTPDQAATVLAGNGLVSIHLAPGGNNQACAGLIRNN